MAFDDLAKGDKRELHLTLYETDIEVLDAICLRYGCSRSAAVGELIRLYADTEIAPQKARRGRPPASTRERN